MESHPTPPSITSRPYSEADFDGYRAAPLLIVGMDARQDLIEAQDRLAENFREAAYYELYPYAKASVIEFVSRSIVTRMQQREGLNGTSYLHRKHAVPYATIDGFSAEAIREAAERAQVGAGTVRQNELARVAFGMDSIEYANATFINGFRKEIEPAMWRDVSDLVGADASPRPDQMYSVQVLGFDRDIRTQRHIGAMRIGMKRKIGTLDDGTIVKGRTAAIINMSPSTGVNPGLVEEFQEAARHNVPVESLESFEKAVAWLVSSSLPDGLVLARNETVYGVSAPRI
jgi:hypothetical protein